MRRPSLPSIAVLGLLGLLAGCPATKPVNPTAAPAPPSAIASCPDFVRKALVPPFPGRAVALNLNSGSVTIDFLVGFGGVPTDLQVVSSTHPVFTEPAIDAVKKLRCTGSLGAVRTRAVIDFRNGGDGG